MKKLAAQNCCLGGIFSWFLVYVNTNTIIAEGIAYAFILGERRFCGASGTETAAAADARFLCLRRRYEAYVIVEADSL